MSVEDKARAILEKMGLTWPDGDPDELREAAKAWRAFAESVDEVKVATNRSARSIIEVNNGEAVDAFEKFWSRYVGQGDGGWLRDLPKASRSMAEGLEDLAEEIDAAMTRLWTEIGISASVIVGGIILTGPTLGASDMAAVAAARSILALGVTLRASISATAARIVAGVLAGYAFGGVESAVLNLAVAQPMRILAGQQDGISLEEVSQAAKTGSLYGGALGPFAVFGPAARAPALRPASLRGELIPATASRPAKNTPTRNDPVDIATGAMLMEHTDLTLPAAFPLVFTRTHLSSYRAGVCFGPTWTSTLDEQVQLDAEGVVFAAADGMRLVYPVPEPDVPTLPESGPRWPLEWDGEPDGTLKVTDPDSGVVRTFAHPGPTQEDATTRLPIESWQDRNGALMEVDRDAEGVPTALRHSGGYHLAVECEGQRVTALRLLDEAPSGYERESSAAPGTLIARYGYDAAGNLSEVVDSSGLAFRYTYDDDGRVLVWMDRNGTWFRYEYDAAGRVVRTRGIDGYHDGAFSYDTTARTTVYTDSSGQHEICRYDENGHLVSQTDPLGHTTRTVWNERGTGPLSVTDPLGRTTRYGYDAEGNLTSVVLPNGASASAAYGPLRQPTSVTEPGGGRWQHAYDASGNLTRTVDPTGATTTYRYDERGHLTAVTDALGNRRLIDTDAAGLPVAVTDATGGTTRIARDTFGRVTAITDPLGHVTRMAWTPEGKPRWREDPEGGRETWSWDGEGNLLSHTDAAGHTTRHTPAPFDVPATRTEADGAAYTFGYDTEMRLTHVTNPQGLEWSYAYDAAGRLVSETDFNGATIRYALDDAGQVVARTNAVGQTLRYTRDAAGQVTAQHDEATGARTTFAYDAAGDLVRATGPEVDLALTRDARGRILTETVDGATMTYAYDALGRRTHRTTPSGLTSVWTYDAEGRPGELATGHGALTFTYDAAGRETSRSCGDVVLTQSWDAADRLTTQTAQAGSHLLQHRAYTYRPDGHLTEIAELATGTRRFDLDPIGRVTGVRAHGWRETYAYDTAGNITSSEAPAHEAAGDRDLTGTLLHRAGRTTYAYDAAGRRTCTCRRLLDGRTRTWTYTWDAEDRLTRAVTPEGTWTYTYDPLGRRVAKTGPDGARLTFRWEGTRVAEQSTADGRTTTWDYTPETHRPVAQTDHTPLVRTSGESLLTKLTEPTATAPRFHAVLTDLTGTPTELVTPAGTVTWQLRTTLWGTPLPAPHPDPGLTCPLRFPGQYADPETGLHYNYFRHYDPTTARYLTPDPLGLVPAPNHHGYVHNPLVTVDPLGLAGCPKVTASAAFRDWANKGAHVHIGKNEVRIFPDHKGGIGAEPIRLRHGAASDKEVQQVLEEIRSSPALREDIAKKADSVRTEMNAGTYGTEKNRALEIHFLIKALKGME